MAYLNRARAYAATGEAVLANADYGEALHQFNEVSAAAKPDARAMVYRGISHQSQGDYDRALADYSDAIRLDASLVFAYSKRGALLVNQKAQVRKAIDDFSAALVLTPGDGDLLAQRGDAYGALGDYGAALSDLNRAVIASPMSAETLVRRGLVKARLNDVQGAAADYTAALALDAHSVDALVNRAAIFSTSGQTSRAIEDLDTAIEDAPNNALAFYNRGYAHFARREFDAAIADYSGAIDRDPRQAWAYANRCLARSITGKDMAGASLDCDKALELLPQNPEVRETRGFLFLKLGKPDTAIHEYEVALQVDPNRPLALYGRGLARIMKGDKIPGEADRRAARALYPNIDREFEPYGLK